MMRFLSRCEGEDDDGLRFQYIPLQRARCDGRILSNTYNAGFTALFLDILLCESVELAGIFFFYGAAFAVELLDIVEPADSDADLSSSLFYRISCDIF